MFKYLWIIMLGIVYLCWTIYAIVDICSNVRDFYRELKDNHVFDIYLLDLDDSTIGWFIVTIAIPLIASLTVFLCS